MKITLLALALFTAAAAPSSPARTDVSAGYRRAPEEVRAVLDAPLPPAVFVNPVGDRVLLARSLRYPPIAELAEPLLKLAGVRLHPHNNARQGDGDYVEVSLQRLPDGHAQPVSLPADARVGSFRWNAAGTKVGTVNANQQVNGGRWNTLGTFSFSAGWNKVQLSRWTTSGYYVIADAIQVR